MKINKIIAASFLAAFITITFNACSQTDATVSKDVALCTKCGDIKGSATCCKPESREKCAECDLFKGSPGCCKIPEGATDAKICGKCGDIKGTDTCCKPEGREKCTKCGLFKGSPGCCKLDKI